MGNREEFGEVVTLMEYRDELRGVGGKLSHSWSAMRSCGESPHSWSSMRCSVDGTSVLVEYHKSVVTRASTALLGTVAVGVECHGHAGRQHCVSATS